MSDVGQSSKLRILCLHGFLQSGEVFWSRIGSLRKGLKSRAEFIVVDAPHKIDGSFDEQLQAAGGTRDSPRAWFRWEVGPGTLWLHDACNGHTSRSSCVDENMTLHAVAGLRAWRPAIQGKEVPGLGGFAGSPVPGAEGAPAG